MPSRSKAMTAVSAFMPSTANNVVFGSRSAASPKITACGEIALRPDSKQVSQRQHARGLGGKLALRRRCGRPEGRDAGDILGAGAHAALLAAAADQRLREMNILTAADERADALRSADLVGRKRRSSRRRARRYRRQYARAPAPRRRGARPPAACTIAAASATGCTTPVSLLASMSETSGRDALPGGLGQRRKIDAAVRRDGNILDRTARKAAAGPHRGMLDRRHQEPVARLLFVRGLDRRRQRQHIGLGPARGEEHVAGLRPDERRHLLRAPARPAAGQRGPRRAPRTDCRRPPARPRSAACACGRSGAVAFQSK